jgi:hypothetical protein
LVLAIAGVLVVVGVALIVLSIVLARKQAAPEDPTSVTPAPATGPAPASGTDTAFIDQPLQTDMAAALGHTASPPQEDDDPTEETSVVELQTQNDTGGSTRPDKED